MEKRNIGIKKKYKKNGIMFCKVAKSIYICISKQGKVHLPPRQVAGYSVKIAVPSGDNWQKRGGGRRKEFFSKIFAMLKNTSTFVIEKR